MSVELITKEDLETFRQALLNDIKYLLDKKDQQVKEWLKPAEVRKLLGISAGTLLTLRATGKLHYSKIGGTYYYCYQDIQNMLVKASDSHE
ncbi:helix-turn-helix domain-containing protein [Mucilaginibacter sp. SP1R1]|uniref:helix-turn-helix domain-containing protein n=1 Tax=Mucilaginibacter sp. SP1R1 TaxID=2723091 RepID=UPI00161C48E0|nr:helix-turn-helix domain-containing protein [Mucilaginibacter sp. SP1R1]MBB6150699.1 DNA-binding ferritin-like protein (Dps family) [Mucilaginibacter sp. SP1R1]